MTILMCRPDHFGIEYEINPWMHVENTVDRARAIEQWERLHATYLELGQQVELIDPVKGLPDMVFSANAAVLWQRKAVISRFRHGERQGEESHWQRRLEELGFAVTVIDPDIFFEGAGDALFVGDRLFLGWGFRTDRASHALVGEALGVEHTSLQLVDPRFYHLDTCFSPLDATTAIYHRPAFSPESAETLQRLVPNLIEVDDQTATGFACNAMTIGKQVVSGRTIGNLDAALAEHGFTTVSLVMDEFMKSGGGVRCLSLPLEVGPQR